jgi:hypothetical protein
VTGDRGVIERLLDNAVAAQKVLDAGATLYAAGAAAGVRGLRALAKRVVTAEGGMPMRTPYVLGLWAGRTLSRYFPGFLKK